MFWLKKQHQNKKTKKQKSAQRSFSLSLNHLSAVSQESFDGLILDLC